MIPACDLAKKIQCKTKLRKKFKYLIACALKIRGYLGGSGENCHLLHIPFEFLKVL